MSSPVMIPVHQPSDAAGVDPSVRTSAEGIEPLRLDDLLGACPPHAAQWGATPWRAVDARVKDMGSDVEVAMIATSTYSSRSAC